MDEEVFRSILEKAVMSEYADLDSDPEPKYSLKHRLAMKRIFAKYERNVRNLKEKRVDQTARNEYLRPRLNLKQRLLIALIVVFLAALTGCAVAAFVSKDFRGTVHRDNTQLFAVDIENSPMTIEYKYALDFVPEGFELIETIPSSIIIYTLYLNRSAKQTITLEQCVKTYFSPHYNTEKNAFEEIKINDVTGLFIDLSRGEREGSALIWDNKDYIIEIIADLDKESTINLSKINKI